MKKLSPRTTEIVTMVGRDGLDWQAVGSALQISRSTIMAHVHRAMARHGLANRKPREACVALYLTIVVRYADA